MNPPFPNAIDTASGPIIGPQPKHFLSASTGGVITRTHRLVSPKGDTWCWLTLDVVFTRSDLLQPGAIAYEGPGWRLQIFTLN